jgi:hypothetical protein
MIFVDMIVRSLNFRCEDILNIHEFIWYEKEKKFDTLCLGLSSYG